jgi:hypothetical protein
MEHFATLAADSRRSIASDMDREVFEIAKKYEDLRIRYAF